MKRDPSSKSSPAPTFPSGQVEAVTKTELVTLPASPGTAASFDSALDPGEQHVFRNNVSLSGRNGDVFLGADSSHNSWNALAATRADFVSLDTDASPTARNADRSLPLRGLFELSPGSHLIDAGTNVGIAYEGSAPDHLGPFEAR
jgi:hypothetical protein